LWPRRREAPRRGIKMDNQQETTDKDRGFAAGGAVLRFLKDYTRSLKY